MKRAMIVTPGVVALAVSAFVTAAAAPATSTSAGPLLTSHKSVAALTTETSTPQAARGSADTTLRLSPALNTPSPALNFPSQPKAAAPIQSPSASTRGQGNTFGKLISSLARVIPGGPDHGKLISFFAKALNPSNSNHARGRGIKVQ